MGWISNLNLCIYDLFFFTWLRKVKLHTSKKKSSTLIFILNARQMIKEHKTAIHVRDVKWTFLTKRGILVEDSFSTQTITAPIIIREVNHHAYVKRQTRICIMWPTFLFTCRLPFIISTPKLVVSRNLSIRIVFSCFYLLIFYFEKFSTRIWRLINDYMKLYSGVPLARAWAEPHSEVNLPIPENLVITWRLRIFRDTLILVFVNENCCLFKCFTELYFFY